MRKKYQSPQAEVQAIPGAALALPTDKPVGVYYRQSTMAQIGNVSTAIQTIDMVEYLKKCGWPEDKIILIDADKGVSGSKTIEEREGMRQLFDLVVEGKIGAVACQDEDRLFRDVTAIQVNIFIQACKTSRVLVITPSMVYNFSDEPAGSFHVYQFRFKSEMAAQYITAVIRGKLHRAKRRVLMEGRWAGPGIPPGFMIDMRKTLPDGSKNENWRRFAPFEPYAEVVREYFQLFLRFGGNIRATARHIHEHGPWYPDPHTCKPPDGYKAVYRIRWNGKGYCPGRTGLTGLLTQVAYIGHWAVNDTVVRWHNHPAIVPEDVFMRAFNYISEATIDGHSNPDYKPISEHARPSCEADRPAERPLCAGIIVAQHAGIWRKVGTNWVQPLQHYAYVMWGADAEDKYVWSKTASYVDEAVAALLRNRLTATFDAPTWERTLASFTKNIAAENRRKAAQLAALEQVMKNQIAGLDVLTSPEMISALQSRYEEAKAEYARLAAEIAAAENEARQLQAAYALKDTCGPTLENWPNASRDEKRVILHAFIDRIEATPVQNHGLKLVAFWRDDSTDEIILPRQATNGTQWLPTEVEQLLEFIDRDAPQEEIAAAFPDRKWKAIHFKAWSLRGSGVLKYHPKLIKEEETYEDYLVRKEDDSLADTASGTDSERARLGGLERFRRAGGSCRRPPGLHVKWCDGVSERAGAG